MKTLFLIIACYIFWAIVSYNSNVRFTDPVSKKTKRLKIKSLSEVDPDFIGGLNSQSELNSQYYFLKTCTNYQLITPERIFQNKKLYSTDPYFKIFCS